MLRGRRDTLDDDIERDNVNPNISPLFYLLPVFNYDAKITLMNISI